MARLLLLEAEPAGVEPVGLREGLGVPEETIEGLFGRPQDDLWRRKQRRTMLVWAGMVWPPIWTSSPRIREMMGTLWYSLEVRSWKISQEQET